MPSRRPAAGQPAAGPAAHHGQRPVRPHHPAVTGREARVSQSSGLSVTARAARNLSAAAICAGGIGLLLYLALDTLGSFQVFPVAGIWALGILAGGVASGLLASALSLRSAMTSVFGRWLARRYRPAFVDAAELDPGSRILLWRAQQAIDAALGSEVAGARMLDYLKASMSLPARMGARQGAPRDQRPAGRDSAGRRARPAERGPGR